MLSVIMIQNKGTRKFGNEFQGYYMASLYTCSVCGSEIIIPKELENKGVKIQHDCPTINKRFRDKSQYK